MATQSDIKTNEQTVNSTQNKDTKQSDLPWWLQPEVIDEDEEKKVNSLEESLQKQSDIPLAPVTFNFVGIRPSKLHVKNNQISTISFNENTTISCVKITFADLTLSDSVNKLSELLYKQFDIPQTRQSLLIYYGHTKLSKEEELLSNYGITDNSVLLLAIYDNINTQHKDIYYTNDNEQSEEEISRSSREQMRVQRDMDSVKQRLQRIKDLRNGIKPKANINKPKTQKEQIAEIMTLKKLLKKHKNIEMVNGLDIISQETNVSCIKLPICSHLLSADSLYQFSLSQFINREQKIKCPHTITNDSDHKLCNQIFEYPLIKQCLLANNGKKINYDFNKLELLSVRNTIELNYDLQICPECSTLLYRNQRDNNFICKTKCPLCVEKESVFCWGCNEKWSNLHECDTSFKANTMEILSQCPTKKVGPSKKCPSVRACPKCYQLINHVSACKHMKCTLCKTNFCFICLKMMENGKWKCGGYSDSCPTHKRQNYSLLPKLNQTSFSVF